MEHLLTKGAEKTKCSTDRELKIYYVYLEAIPIIRQVCYHPMALVSEEVSVISLNSPPYTRLSNPYVCPGLGLASPLLQNVKSLPFVTR